MKAITKEQQARRDKANLAREKRIQRYKRYVTAMSNRSHAVQISHQRSGRNWLSSLIRVITGANVQTLDLGKMDFIPGNNYFTSHLYPEWQIGKPSSACYIALVRDPRDAIRSQLEFVEVNSSRDIWSGVNTIKVQAQQWAKYLGILQYDAIMVQYEYLCLYPLNTIKRILAFSNLEAKKDIMEVVKERDLTLGQLSHKTNYDRYKAHCLKWKTDDRLLPNFNDLVWDMIGDTMIHYGYLKDGHSVNLLTE